MAVRVLPGILKIREMLPEVLVHDSGGDAFVADRIGTGIRFWWPIPVGLRRGKTLQLPDTNRILLLNWAGTTCSSKDSGSCSTLLAKLWRVIWYTDTIKLLALSGWIPEKCCPAVKLTG